MHSVWGVHAMVLVWRLETTLWTWFFLGNQTRVPTPVRRGLLSIQLSHQPSFYLVNYLYLGLEFHYFIEVISCTFFQRQVSCM